MHLTLIGLFLTIALQCVQPARILGVFPVSGKSVNILYNKLMTGLADAGNDVTVISAYPNKRPTTNGSFTDVVLTGFAEDYQKMLDTYFTELMPESTSLWESKNLNEIFLPIYNQTFHHPNVVKFLQTEQQFDVVVIEHLWADCLLAFAAFFNCPAVVFSSMGGVNPWLHNIVGDPLSSSYVPHIWMLGDFSAGMTFPQRIHNAIFYVADHIYTRYVQFPAHDEVIERAFHETGRVIPKVAELHRSVSLVLLGSHSSFRQATPHSPNMVEIGGFHIDPPKKLPEALQKFMDEAKQGAIYFSMGSHMQSKYFTKEIKRVLLNVFGRLNVKVVWKYEEDLGKERPSNVLVRKWVPQADILAHPNLKLFITHAGHGSIQETIYHGVPALMIPAFGDQFNNAYRCVAKGFALKMSLTDQSFNEENFLRMIEEMLQNPVYSQKAKEISRLFHDRPMKPLDTAVYWVEYVARNKGADHLKLAGRLLPLYKFYMLDVCLLVGFLVSLPLLGCYYLSRKIRYVKTGKINKDKQL